MTPASSRLDATFAALADPTRRAILARLASGAATVNELADTIGRLLEKQVAREYEPPRAGDLRNSWADVSEARQLLGFEPRAGLEDGLRRTADFLLEGKEN